MTSSTATQKRILDAYKILLTVKGLDELSVGDIVRESKLARSTFYRHYKDKYEPIHDILTEVFGRYYLEPNNCRDAKILLYNAAVHIIENRSYLSALFYYKGQNSGFELIRRIAGSYQSVLQENPAFSPFHAQLHKGYTYASLYLVYDWVLGDMCSSLDANLLARAIYELCPLPLREVYGWENAEESSLFI